MNRVTKLIDNVKANEASLAVLDRAVGYCHSTDVSFTSTKICIGSTWIPIPNEKLIPFLEDYRNELAQAGMSDRKLLQSIHDMLSYSEEDEEEQAL